MKTQKTEALPTFDLLDLQMVTSGVVCSLVPSPSLSFGDFGWDVSVGANPYQGQTAEQKAWREA